MPTSLLHVLHALPGPHPPLAQLRAYATGEVADGAAHQIEAHTLQCARCADIVEGLQLTDAPTTNQALRELQRRVRQRVEELSPRPALPALRQQTRWPRLAAAAALVAGVGAGLWGWQQHRQTEPKTTLAVVQPAVESAPLIRRVPAAAAPAVASVSAARSAAAARPARRRSRPPGRPVEVAAATKTEAEIAERKVFAQASPAPAAADNVVVAGSVAKEPIGPDTLASAATAVVGHEGQLVKSSVSKAKLAVPAEAVPVPPTWPPADSLPPGTAAMAASAPRTRAALPPPPTLEPMPKTGYRALRTYLQKEAAAFKPEAGLDPMKGVVRVRFTISAAGKPELEDAKILRSLREDYDAEVLRMLAEGPAWIPGVAAGRRASLPVQVEVLF